MLLTGFSPSVVRASIMSILFLNSKLVYRKNDIWTSISLSLLILLIYNPFLITNISVQFTYIATLGIVLLQKNILRFFINIRIRDKRNILRKRKITNNKISKILNFIYEILSVSLSAQIAILPISIISFNTFSLTFLITNFLISFIISPIIILGLILIIIIVLGFKQINFINLILKILINFLIKISEICSKFPFSKIIATTPEVWKVLLYYLSIIIVNYVYSICQNNRLTTFQQRIKNIVYLIKYKIRESKNIISSIIIVIFIFYLIFNLQSKDLQIHFIDVGQGDNTLIITPYNKTILIDGGGSETYKVGEKVLVPYLLDRKVKTIDYMFISHFDTDHVSRFINSYGRIKSKKCSDRKTI